MSKSAPRLIVATRPGVERPATKQEVCRHWMVPRNHWSGGRRARRCAHCGHVDWVHVGDIRSGHQVSQVRSAQVGHLPPPVRDTEAGRS